MKNGSNVIINYLFLLIKGLLADHDEINYNLWNFSDSIVEVNAVVRHFRQPWVPMRKIWQ
jgi:hypothetical protein